MSDRELLEGSSGAQADAAAPDGDGTRAGEQPERRGNIRAGDVREVDAVAIGAHASASVHHHYYAEQETIPYQLPPRPDFFTGREELLLALAAMLECGHTVTLHGSGGIGKTALAGEALWRLQEQGALQLRFPGGLIFHSFYHQPAVSDALQHIALSFGEEKLQPTPVAAAQRALAGRRALLLLDGAEDADDLPAVLDISGCCAVLITTRDRRQATGQCLDLGPLPLEEAVQLLRRWAGAYAEGEGVEALCRLLGQLPLALRLTGGYLARRQEPAASYLAWLQRSPLVALDQGDRQLQSVPLLLQRSVEQLLPSAVQALSLAGRLAFSRFSAAAIASALGYADSNEARRPLDNLADYGLLVRSEGDYHLSHALIHTYARSRLDPGKQALHRLAMHYTVLAVRAWQEGPSAYATLEAARPHALALLPHLAQAEEWRMALLLADAIDDYLEVRGHLADRLAVCQAALAAARAQHNRYDEAGWLGNLGFAYADQGQLREAVTCYQQALTIAREVGDRHTENKQLGNLANAFSNLGRLREAVVCYEQAVALARASGDRRAEGAHLGNLGNAYFSQGRLQEAVEKHREALRIAREIRDRRNEGVWLSNLGNGYRQLGLVEKAVERYQEALAISREVGDRRGEGQDLGNLGIAYAALGRLPQAIAHHQKALAIAREIGGRRGEGYALGNLGNVYRQSGRLDEAIAYHRQALAIAREVGDRRREGSQLGSLGIAHAERGELEEAVRCFEQALTIAREIGDGLSEGVHLRNLANACSELGWTEAADRYEQEALALQEEAGGLDQESTRQALREPPAGQADEEGAA